MASAPIPSGRFILTGGQKHDITQAKGLIAGYVCGHVIADKAYDSQEFLHYITQAGRSQSIPPRSNRKEPHSYDEHLYRERHL